VFSITEVIFSLVRSNLQEILSKKKFDLFVKFPDKYERFKEAFLTALNASDASSNG
jgi:hypothetical protein